MHLWRENVFSYAAEHHDNSPQQFLYRDVNVSQYTDLEIIKALQKYRYNAAEHPGWLHSKAEQMTRVLFLKLACPLIFDYEQTNALFTQVSAIKGYERLPWGLKPPSSVVSDPQIGTSTPDRDFGPER